MVEADGGCHERIGRGEHPSHKRYKMHQVKYQTVADGKTASLTDESNTGRRRQIVPFTTIIQHGKSIVITFDEPGDHRCDPSYNRNKGKQEDGNRIDRLPETVADGQGNTATYVAKVNGSVKYKFPSFDDGFCFFR